MDTRWQYRTILFEFHKDGLLGDKYIDDEEVERTLNEQGLRGWELVSVSMIQEGLLAFCKRPLRQGSHQRAIDDQAADDGSSFAVKQLQEREKRYIRELSNREPKDDAGNDPDAVDEIRISR